MIGSSSVLADKRNVSPWALNNASRDGPGTVPPRCGRARQNPVNNGERDHEKTAEEERWMDLFVVEPVADL